MDISFRKKMKGFTVGEVVLSSFLMTMGMVSVLSMITFSFRSSIDNQNIIVASELAQEGVELVRNLRDNNLVNKVVTGTPTDVFTGFPNGTNSKCAMDYDDTTLNCSSPDNHLLPSPTFYQTPVGGGTSRFYRVLKMDHANSPNTVRVKSFVTWQNPQNNLNGNGDTNWCTLINKCVYTEIFLTEWQ